ncbi:uncharacterized protein CTHT_0046830 [Thermochaetoides thermophila DSM 1495]|uniref:Uncharacterized protein n=1 Tax=Chaetomium thermophilum (strain DSM 1495 / CBS 144.50 / IMI 039719) TaxID=759272 RepID=G0S9R3_CHATD|nr:hypothetical protein CTHT_0046830 [Thermochaetoides thermophila DSM 1495]EGS20174.1 hypothetical protein CTHT_0046830 [Thermochaetoides thermophila DSM 1495]
MRWQTLLPLFSFPGPSFSELTFTTVHTTGGKLVSASGLPTLKNLRANNPTVNSNNWCGSVNYAPIGRQIRLVHGYFQHPVCEIRNGMKTFPQAVAAWVGIDGDTWTDSLLQAGTVCKIDNSSGVVTNEAWWQWVPSGAYTISTLPVAEDDWFEVTINTTSPSSGEITITNLSQRYTYSVTLSGGPTLARVDADWVVERPYFGKTLSGFATFTDVWFEDTYAELLPGTGTIGVLGANQYQIPGMCTSMEWDDRHLVSWSLQN